MATSRAPTGPSVSSAAERAAVNISAAAAVSRVAGNRRAFFGERSVAAGLIAERPVRSVQAKNTRAAAARR